MGKMIPLWGYLNIYYHTSSNISIYYRRFNYRLRVVKTATPFFPHIHARRTTACVGDMYVLSYYAGTAAVRGTRYAPRMLPVWYWLERMFLHVCPHVVKINVIRPTETHSLPFVFFSPFVHRCR